MVWYYVEVPRQRSTIVIGLLGSIALDGRVIAGYILFYNLLGNSHLPSVRSFSPGPPVIAHIHRLLGNLRGTESGLPASRDRDDANQLRKYVLQGREPIKIGPDRPVIPRIPFRPIQTPTPLFPHEFSKLHRFISPSS